MLRKLSIGVLAVASVFAMGQNTMNHDMSHPSGDMWTDNFTYMGMTGNGAQVYWEANKSLNAGEEYTFRELMRRLPGNTEQAFLRGIAGATQKNVEAFNGDMSRYMINNGTSWNSNNSMTTSGSNMTGTANQNMTNNMNNGAMALSSYPTSDMIRRIGDQEALMMILRSVNDSERALINAAWPTLEVRQQDAILKLVKESTYVDVNHRKFMAYGMDW